MRIISRLFAVSGVLCLVGSSVGSSVVETDEDGARELIASKGPVLLEFYAKWCGACTRLEGDVETVAASEEVKDMGIQVARIDVDKFADFTDEMGLSSFPSFLLWRRGKDGDAPSKLSVPASGEELLAYLQVAMGQTAANAVKEMTTVGDLTGWLFWRGGDGGRMATSLMGFFPPMTQEHKERHEHLADEARAVGEDEAMVAWDTAYDTLDAASIKLLGQLRVGRIMNSEVLFAFSLPKDVPSLVLYKDYDEGKEIYHGPMEADAVAEWALQRSVPLATYVDHYTLRDFQQRNNILVHVFVSKETAEDPAARRHVIDSMWTVASGMEQQGLFSRGDITFAITNGEQYESWLQPYKLRRGRFPSFGLADQREGSSNSLFYKLQLSKEVEASWAATVSGVGVDGETVNMDSVNIDGPTVQAWVESVLKDEATPLK